MSFTSELLRALRTELTVQIGRVAHVAKDHPVFQKEFWSDVKSSYQGEDLTLKAYYAKLELPYGSSLAEVKAAYKTFMKTWHPDKYQDALEKAKATELVKQVNEAYTYLLNHLQK